MDTIDLKPINNASYKPKSQIIKQLEKLLQDKVFNKTKKPKHCTKHFVNTDSMEDEIYYGETVIVENDPSAMLNEKDIFLFSNYYGEKFISRCKLLKNGISLVPNNPSCNNDFFNFDEINMIGKIVSVVKESSL